MLARVYSCAVIGLDGVVVEVEVDYTSGFPGMTIVGLPDAAIQESRERVQAAVRNAGVRFPRKRLVVNLAPALVPKQGPAVSYQHGIHAVNYMLPSSTNLRNTSTIVGSNCEPLYFTNSEIASFWLRAFR